MRSQKTFKWVAGILLICCFGVVMYSFVSISTKPEPARVVSVTPLDGEVAVYEVLYDSGGATVSFVYRYYVLKRQDDLEMVLGQVGAAEPFLVTASSGAVKEVTNGVVSLEVKSTIYQFNGVARYKLNGELKTIRFTLNNH